MFSFLKQNWFRIGMLFCALLIAFSSVYYYVYLPTKTKEVSQPILQVANPETKEDLSRSAKAEEEKVNKLSTGVDLGYFKSILGEPVFVNNVGEPQDILDIYKRSEQCKNSQEQKEFIFVNNLFFVQAITNKNNAVIEYAVTTRRADFNPKFKFWNGEREVEVVLGKSNFFAAISDPPEKIDYYCGAHNFGYDEEHYFGNPGNYQSYIFANNQAGIPGSTIACAINSLQNSPTPISPDRPELKELRKKAIINTYAVTAPQVDIENLCFGIGPTYDQVRVLGK